MTYIYPYGIPKAALSASFVNATISSSFATSAATRALTASLAVSAVYPGPSGSVGPTPSCGAGPQGPTGSVGDTGPDGSSLTGCPPNTRECTNITPPAGYVFVCIQIPGGCTYDRTRCPGEVTTTTTTTTSTTTTTTTAPPCYTFSYATSTALSDCSIGSWPTTGYSNCSTLSTGCFVYQSPGCSGPVGDTYIQIADGTNFQVNTTTGEITNSNNPVC